MNWRFTPVPWSAEQIAHRGAIFCVQSGIFGRLSDSDKNPVLDGKPKPYLGLREKIYVIIFGHLTPKGKAFDVTLMFVIIASIVVVALESVAGLRTEYGRALVIAEWAFTAVFTIEYGLRIYSTHERRAYIFSFFGIIDLVSIIPTYLSLLVPGGAALLTLRALRLLRVFRVFKLRSFLREADTLVDALRSSARKIVVFIGVVLTLALIMGTLMYMIEGGEHGFTSIPKGMYWAIVTMTTVGYGDIAPHTTIGQMVATFVMILGYGIIAVPTGIVSAELVHGRAQDPPVESCPDCEANGADPDAHFCKHCGASL